MQKSFKQNLEWEGCWKVLLKTTGKGNPGKSLLCKFIFKWFLTQNKSWISFWTVCRPPLESFSRRLAGKRRGTNSCRPVKEILILEFVKLREVTGLIDLPCWHNIFLEYWGSWKYPQEAGRVNLPILNLDCHLYHWWSPQLQCRCSKLW